VEEAREAARFTGLFLLSALRAEVGSLDRVRSVLKLFGMVNCAPGFTNTPAVIDGYSRGTENRGPVRPDTELAPGAHVVSRALRTIG
jgi:hypothetical protein